MYSPAQHSWKQVVMARQGTVIYRVTGKISVKQGTNLKQVQEYLILSDIADIETGVNSFAYVCDNPNPKSGKQASVATLFPESKITVYGERGFIEKIAIGRGLIHVSVAPGKLVVTPVAEFCGLAWVNVLSDERTVVANSRETIYNRETRKAITLSANQQVLIVGDTIANIEPMDQRLY
jgi:hypothetical protein